MNDCFGLRPGFRLRLHLSRNSSPCLSTGIHRLYRLASKFMTEFEHSNEFIRLLHEPDHERPRIIFVAVTTTITEIIPASVKSGQTNKYSSPVRAIIV